MVTAPLDFPVTGRIATTDLLASGYELADRMVLQSRHVVPALLFYDITVSQFDGGMGHFDWLGGHVGSDRVSLRFRCSGDRALVYAG